MTSKPATRAFQADNTSHGRFVCVDALVRHPSSPRGNVILTIREHSCGLLRTKGILGIELAPT
jgi:hypothetical protein